MMDNLIKVIFLGGPLDSEMQVLEDCEEINVPFLEGSNPLEQDANIDPKEIIPHKIAKYIRMKKFEKSNMVIFEFSGFSEPKN